jgi:hypothetical protein
VTGREPISGGDHEVGTIDQPPTLTSLLRLRPRGHHSGRLRAFLEDRRDFPVVEVVAALSPLTQPELLQTEDKQAELVLTRGDDTECRLFLRPEH